MRELLNVSYVAQVEAEKFADVAAFEQWEATLNAEPGVVPRRRSHIDPGLLGMLAG